MWFKNVISIASGIMLNSCINVSQPQNVHSICTTMTVSPLPVTVEDNNKVNNTLTQSLFSNIEHNVVHKILKKNLGSFFTLIFVTRLWCKTMVWYFNRPLGKTCSLIFTRHFISPVSQEDDWFYSYQRKWDIKIVIFKSI